MRTDSVRDLRSNPGQARCLCCDAISVHHWTYHRLTTVTPVGFVGRERDFAVIDALVDESLMMAVVLWLLYPKKGASWTVLEMNME
jgi:hypothetical protein